MSLATERNRGQLICRCHHPDPRCVVLFDVWELVDVYECARCWRPVLSIEGCEER
jgi:hypothetical protein